MARSSIMRVSPCFVVLLIATSIFLDVRRLCRASAVARQGVCDDGKYDIDKDLGGEENWRCPSEKYSVATFMVPAGYSHCSNNVEASYQCMHIDLSYLDAPPSFGDFRPLAPKYGEYKYLPPQRWLHAIQRGGLAFLYHPCAPTEQVLKLKELAESCLWRHVITPYPHLNRNSSLAIVSWGCVYRASWVNAPEAKLWIREHALKTEGSSITNDGQYDEGLLHGAVLTDESNICGKPIQTLPSPPPGNQVPGNQVPGNSNILVPGGSDKDGVISDHTTNGGGGNEAKPSPPCKSNSSIGGHKELNDPTPCSQSTNAPPSIIVHASTHGSMLTVLIVLLSLVLFVVLLVVAWRLCGVVRDHCRSKKQARYKSVSKFFPFSYGQNSTNGYGNGIAIPEYGLPKNSAAEREILLNDSDEDEL